MKMAAKFGHLHAAAKTERETAMYSPYRHCTHVHVEIHYADWNWGERQAGLISLVSAFDTTTSNIASSNSKRRKSLAKCRCQRK